MRALIVEDNHRIAELVGQALGGAGFASDHAGTVEDARQALTTQHFDLVVLDLGMPDEDGIVLLREMRVRRQSTPVLILTARGTLDERVGGLEAGADDFLAKPFAVEELIARARALTRRQGALLGDALTLGNLRLDSVGRQAYVDERPVLLSAREIDLLERLLRRAGRVVAKPLLEGDLVNLGPETTSNLIEVYVHRLRRKLADGGANVTIHTLRGVGYILAEGR
jgi:DNA-binding response OmpR family regulator